MRSKTPRRPRGLVSPPSGRGVRASASAPPDALSAVVEKFWTGQWDLRAQPAHTTLLLSDPSVHIVFESGDSPTAGARIVGVWTKLWRRTLSGRGCVRGVKLRAGAARAFLPGSASRWTDRITPLDDAFAVDTSELQRAVLEAEDAAAANSALTSWLRSIQSSDETVSLAIQLVQCIVSDPTLVRVEQLSTKAGMSPRQLQQLFRDYVGASPKWVMRRHRLQEVAARLDAGLESTLTSLAAELGYTDQAHLTHDFKAAVGKTPSELLASARSRDGNAAVLPER